MKTKSYRGDIVERLDKLIEEFDNPPEESKTNPLWQIKIKCMRDKFWQIRKKLVPDKL
jgi:hypothetical protein